MTGNPPDAAASPAGNGAWPVRAVWIEPVEGAAPRVETVPSTPAAGGELFLVTNQPETLTELLQASPAAAGWQVVDFAELHRLALPTSAAENATEMIRESGEAATPSGAALWRAWLRLAAALEALPFAALETVELLCRDLGDAALARLLGRFAADAHLRHRGGANWLDAFAASVRRVEPRTLPAHTDCSPLDAEAAAALLEPGGALAGRVAGYEPRPGQLAMLRAVIAAFNDGSHLMVEAGTGVGKSLAYLLPAALWARLNDTPVVISTNTRNLQTQLVEKDLPAVTRVLDAAHPARPLRTALIKGRSNYLCLRRMSYLLDHGAFDLPRQEQRQFARAVLWSVRTPDGDLDALSGGAGVEPAFLSLLGSLGEECAGRACKLFRRCFVQKARERALQADLIVANHALVFAEMGSPGISLPAHAQLVFDEAHNLEEAATRHFSLEFSPARLSLLLRRLGVGHGRRRGGGVLDALRGHAERGSVGGDAAARHALLQGVRATRAAAETLRDAGFALCAALGALLDGNDEAYRFVGGPSGRRGALPGSRDRTAAWAEVGEAHAGFREAARQLATQLQQLADRLLEGARDELDLMASESSDLTGAIQLLQNLLLDSEIILAGSDVEHVFWVQRARTRERLGEAWAAPLAIDKHLNAGLYTQRQSIVFCSATLTVAGRFDFMAGRLGLHHLPPERLRTCQAASPFDYPRQCAVIAPAFLPDPVADGAAYVAALAALMRAVTTALQGRTLGLFTSYEMLRACSRHLAAPLREAGIRMLVQGESGSRDQLTRTFRRGGRCLLLGTHSFWEGVDVVGDALSCVILARLPFVAPGEPVFGARCEQLDAAGTSSFSALSLPTAVIRFRQGFGRLIRHRGDSGLVIVADNRILSKSYGAVFRRSLPCATQPGADCAAVVAEALRLAAPPADEAPASSNPTAQGAVG